MTHQEMWQAFSLERGIEAYYEAWAFGADADELSHLVLNGLKTATSSLLRLYEQEGCDLPREGQYSVVLDSAEKAVCIIRTTKVYTLPFMQVTADHAWKEGEGDRSLAYWRRVHAEFFSTELGDQAFDPSMDVVCEEFLRVYP